MTLSPREEIASATMIATHELVLNLTRAKSAMENLVHAMADLTALVTAEGRVLWGNQTAAEWLGASHDLIHETNLRTLFSDDDWLRVRRRLKALDEGKSQAEEETSILEVNGDARDVLWSFRPFHAVSDRRGLLIIVSGHDVTEVLQARSERARLEAELETAQILQQRFLPPPYIKTEGLEIASFYRPAEQCSGDWWGHFDLGAQREMVCIADVTGHGAASALVTAMTQALCLSFVDRNRGKDVAPAQLLSEINDIICRTFRGDMYMTFFCLVIDRAAGHARASNAAHNFPFLLRVGREPKQNPEAIIVQGNPIGHEEGAPFRDITIPVAKGDRFVLYTDGITECRNAERKMYGSGAFRRSILRHASEGAFAFRDKLIQDAMAFYAGQPLADDITLAIIDI